MDSAAHIRSSLSVGGTAIVCNDNVNCDQDPYRHVLTQFINSFVDGTINDLQAKSRIISTIPDQKILNLKGKVFEVCTNHDFPDKLNHFNAFMKTIASIVDIGGDGVATSIYDFYTPKQIFSIGEKVVDSNVVSLYIAGFTLHMFLQDPSFIMHIPEIHMSDLKTFRGLLTFSEDLRTAYFEQRTRITGFGSSTPDNDEVIVLATDFFSNGGRSDSAHGALTTTRIIMDDRVEREKRGGGSKKQNKSKRRNQNKSNKKSRRHRNRKRLSRRNAKRFY